MRLSQAIVGGAVVLAVTGGLFAGPIAAQTAAPAISAQDERLLSLLPPGLQGSGSVVLLAPNAVAQEAALRKLVEQAEAPQLLVPVAAFVAGLGDANRCPENAKDWNQPRSFPCVSQLSSALSRSGDATVRRLLERWAASHPDVRVADAAVRALERADAAGLGVLLEQRAALARAAGDAAGLAAIGAAQERVGSRLPLFWWKPPARFEVVPPSRPVRVVAIGDMGTGSAEQTAIAATLRAAHAKQPFDFGITLGDNYQDDGPAAPDDPRWQTYWSRLYPPLGLTFYASLGNHDWGNPDGPAASVVFAQRDPAYRLPAPYYTYTAGPVQFFVINTPLLSEAQLVWLKGELAASTARWRVVYGHYQMYSALRGDNQALITKLLPILKEHRVHVYLCGHEHLFQHLEPEGGVEFFVSGASGAGGRVARQVGYPRVQFMAERTQGYTVLEAGATALRVQFVDANGQVFYEKTLR
jgi:hypothetical protein